VANLTYRNEDNLQVPLYISSARARLRPTYDQLTATASWLAHVGLLLTTRGHRAAARARRTHGYHIPSWPAYPTTTTSAAGVVERTIPASPSMPIGSTAVWSVTAGGGVHLIHNAGHVTGASDTRWVGVHRSDVSPSHGRTRSRDHAAVTGFGRRAGLALLLLQPFAATPARAQGDSLGLHTTLWSWADDALLHILDRDRRPRWAV